MKTHRLAAALCFASLASPVCRAATEGAVQPNATVPAAELGYSTSSLPNAPEAEFARGSRTTSGALTAGGTSSMRPFSRLGIGVVAGVGGVGIELATPLAQRLNLRASGDFFAYSPNFTVSGITIVGNINFRSVNTSLDWFPFAGRFRISPGVTVYNGNKLTANATVPAGTTFTLNDVDYISGTCSGYNPNTGQCPANATYTNPVNGTFNAAFGNKVAPSITIGWGNLIPRSESSHWSVPFEIGMQYIGDPLVNVSLAGQACSTSGSQQGCGAINTGDNLANLNAQVVKINNDIAPLRTYPILKLGVGYKF